MRGEAVFTTDFWQSILDQQDTISQGLVDIAHTNLHDTIGIGQTYRTRTIDEDDVENTNGEPPPDGWILVECWNRNDPRVVGTLSPNDVVILAGQAYLSFEEEQNKLLPLMCNVNTVRTVGVKSSYTKLYEAAQNIVADSNSNNNRNNTNNQNNKNNNDALKNSYIVMAMLENKDQKYKTAVQLLKKAVKLDDKNKKKKDWRLHSRLGTYYMCNYEVQQSLQCLVRAEKMTTASTLAPDDAAFYAWQISTSRAKVLNHLERSVEAKNLLESVVQDYHTTHQHNPRCTVRLVGRLAVAQYMLSMLYAMLDDGGGGGAASTSTRKEHLKKAKYHFREADQKRNSIPVAVAQNIDWGNRSVAQMLLQQMAAVFPSNHVEDQMTRTVTTHNACHQCGIVTTKTLNCQACKKARYCSKECQIIAWQSGHKKECKLLQQR